MSDKFDSFADAVRRLNALTSAPEFGHFTYALALKSVFDEVVKAGIGLGLGPRTVPATAEFRTPFRSRNEYLGASARIMLAVERGVERPQHEAVHTDMQRLLATLAEAGRQLKELGVTVSWEQMEDA